MEGRTTFVENRKNEFMFSFRPYSIAGTGPEKSQSFGSSRLTASPDYVGHDRVLIS